ncbi:PqqA peptide cyclase [subsurface metagenome]
MKGIIFSSSGEPLTNPEIIDFIAYTKEIGIDVALVTNGTALQRPGLIETLARDVKWIRISLDAGTPETRAKIHGVFPEDFEKVLESLKMLATEKARKESSCHIGAQIVITEENWWEVYLAARRVKETRIDYFQIKPVVFHPKDNKVQLSCKFWETALGLIDATKREFEDEDFDVFVKYDQFEAIMAPDYEKSAYEKCRADFFPIVEATGKVYHCSQTRGLPEFELGDLSQMSFKEIWNGEKRKKIIENIDVSKCQPVCRCHWLNKMLKTVALGKNAPNFV